MSTMIDNLLDNLGGSGLPTESSWEAVEKDLKLQTTRTSKAKQVVASETDNLESMDFEDAESVAWRKHHLRRFFQDRGSLWTVSRRSTVTKWSMCIVIGVIIALLGLFVKFCTSQLVGLKLYLLTSLVEQNRYAAAFFSYLFVSQAFVLGAGLLCWLEPDAAGSGIPEIKAYLNGVNLNKLVRLRVLVAKLFGMCLSCASGLPLGKEGPMIHVGSIVGAAVSQGKTITLGIDTSWTKFQDLRNDRSKRDFVTFGAAAGVAAAFSAPIGGILFTLEEGASFWSTTLTFRAFFCAMVTELTINLLTSGVVRADKGALGLDQSVSMFDFGSFSAFQGYHTYELLIFIGMGMLGGTVGALFNHFVERLTLYRRAKVNASMPLRLAELLLLCGGFAMLSFLLPLLFAPLACTDFPTQIAAWSAQQQQLLGRLVRFNCREGQYNQLASLFLVDADTALQQLFHFIGPDQASSSLSSFSSSSSSSSSSSASSSAAVQVPPTFSSSCLLIFFIPYLLFAALTIGTLCPAGIFVPTLLSGAALGRVLGHVLHVLFPTHVMDAGSYALIGAAAVLGGVTRMTIAGSVILLEACGNSDYLLPLMITFAAARYSGNAITRLLYDLQLSIKRLPFLEGQLRSLGPSCACVCICMYYICIHV